MHKSPYGTFLQNKKLKTCTSFGLPYGPSTLTIGNSFCSLICSSNSLSTSMIWYELILCNCKPVFLEGDGTRWSGTSFTSQLSDKRCINLSVQSPATLMSTEKVGSSSDEEHWIISKKYFYYSKIAAQRCS